MFKDIAELREQIKAFGLERHEEKIVALAKPAIRMLPSRVEDEMIPIGASKLGGNPDLPPDFEWRLIRESLLHSSGSSNFQSLYLSIGIRNYQQRGCCIFSMI